MRLTSTGQTRGAHYSSSGTAVSDRQPVPGGAGRLSVLLHLHAGTRTSLLIGTAVILGLGLVWTGMFFHLMHTMAAKTSRSVGQLIQEIRTIRKEDPPPSGEN